MHDGDDKDVPVGKSEPKDFVRQMRVSLICLSVMSKVYCRFDEGGNTIVNILTYL